jgi:Na+/melibiose symporter-like transporter
MQNFTTKMQNSATTMIEGILLKKLGYNKEAKAAGLPQSEHFIKWQWPMFVLGPAVGSVFYLIIILFIKDDKQTKLETERKLKAMREERAKTQA